MRESGVRVWLLFAFALSVVFPAAGHAADAPANVTVNAATDGVAANCELRDAIETINGNGVADACTETTNGTARSVIDFDIGTDGSLQTIAVTVGQLPVISQPVEIDGRNLGLTQIGIQLDGSALASVGTDGLVLFPGSNGSYVHHLAVHSFPDDGILSSSETNTIEQVISGSNRPALTDLGNGGDGIQIEGDDTTVTDSLVSANDANGIEIRQTTGTSTASGTTITGSVIGMNRTGTAPLANSLDGIHANLGASVAVGGDAADITIGGSDPIGAAATCPAQPIGTGDCNLISGNGDAGIEITVTGTGPNRATDLVISGNYVGTTANGLAAGDTTPVTGGTCGTEPAGIKLGGAVEAPVITGNLVSGNTGKGIALVPAPGASSDVGVYGASITANIVGLDRDGALALGNQCAGIDLSATIAPGPGEPLTEVLDNTVGGTDDGPTSACDGDCNVISANGSALDDGISISGRVTGTSILGNFVGTDVTGMAARPNTQSGIAVAPFEYDPGEEAGTIGSPAAPNLISGNTLHGVRAAWSDADPAPGPIDLDIQSNQIGLAADGTSAIPNGDSGVDISGEGTAGVTVGGLAAALGNTIAHNGEDGVTVVGHADGSAFDNPILGNSIFSNGLLGIDLRPAPIDDGVTENGDCTAASPNGCQPFPVLRAAAGGSAAVAGELEADPSSSYRIELFANSAADPSGNGEGERLLGATTVTTGPGGTVEWLFADPAGDLADGEFVTATATALDGSGGALSTSEFSDALAAPVCDRTGTPQADSLAGDGDDEILCGLAGADSLDGGLGRDALFGGLGNDALDARDGQADALIDCGAGTDTVEADSVAVDPAALFVGCETIERPATDPLPDTIPPQLAVDGDKKQKSKKKIVVEATCENEACDLEATGTIKVKILGKDGKVDGKETYDLKRASAEDAAAGAETRLKLKFKNKAKKKIAKVIKLKKSKAKAFVTATDAAGNATDEVRFKVSVKK